MSDFAMFHGPTASCRDSPSSVVAAVALANSLGRGRAARLSSAPALRSPRPRSLGGMRGVVGRGEHGAAQVVLEDNPTDADQLAGGKNEASLCPLRQGGGAVSDVQPGSPRGGPALSHVYIRALCILACTAGRLRRMVLSEAITIFTMLLRSGATGLRWMTPRGTNCSALSTMPLANLR